MNKFLMITLFFAGFLAFTSDVFAECSACSLKGEEMKTKEIGLFDKFFNEAKVEDGVRFITYDQFIKLRNSGENFVLLDVLLEESYKNGHIEGAKSFPIPTINKENAEKLLTKDDNIIVYCGRFQCHASTNAAKILIELGYKVVDYKGGLKEWQEKGNKFAN